MAPLFFFFTDIWGRSSVFGKISADILRVVCNHLEPLSRDIVKSKREKSQTIHSLSGVCRLWSQHITSGLLSDIAFDTSFKESITTAGVFLKKLEGANTTISVYANLGDSESPNPDPMTEKLFIRLRHHIPHITYFKCYGNIAGYRSYLDCPAPNITSFSDFLYQYESGPPLFCGQMPRLQSLTTCSRAPQVNWMISGLPDLTFLELRFTGEELYVPLSPLLDLLQGSPRLEHICIHNFNPVINANKLLRSVSLPHLHTLLLAASDLHTILKHLTVPCLRRLHHSSKSHPEEPPRGTLSPTCQAPHLFTDLPSLPIFEQLIKNLHFEASRNDIVGHVDLFLVFSGDEKFSFETLMRWHREATPLLDGFLKRTIAHLASNVTFAPQAYGDIHLGHFTPLEVYKPLLFVDAKIELIIQGEFAVDVLRELTAQASSQHLPPRLHCLSIVDQLPLSHESNRRALLSCLQSHFAGNFSIRLMDSEILREVCNEPGYIITREFVR